MAFDPIDPNYSQNSRAVPTGRLKRFASLGGLALGVATNALTSGLKSNTSSGVKDWRSLLLTPKNAALIAEKLAHMRGAAMKMGQLMSMDAGDLLPKELADILSGLRSSANAMPIGQLKQQLESELGQHWYDHFAHFELKPIAAASIGQVHAAYSLDGQKLAVKVQYPGVVDAINSDVENLAIVLRTLRLAPAAVDIKSLMQVAKLQLHAEADYQTEAGFLTRYRTRLKDQTQFVMPEVIEQSTTKQLLTMSFVDGEPLDDLLDLPQHKRNEIVVWLIELFMREVFDFKLLQSDPNMANYRYQRDTHRLVLLDFGATREVSNVLSDQYRQLLWAILDDNRQQQIDSLTTMSFINPGACPRAIDIIHQLLDILSVPLQTDMYHFGNSQLLSEANALVSALNQHQAALGNPAPEVMFIHRKALGLLLIARRLQASLPIAVLLRKQLSAI